MVLSPADFYAYSRATGAPIPEDAQERAAMAPEVLEFRRNQLKAPQQESNTLQTLGTATLGLGAAIGAGLAGRRFLGGRSQTAFEIPKAPVKSATAGLTQVDLSNLQRVQAEVPDLTTVQQATAPARSNQFVNAVQSGEDQMTGRMKMQLSRNEDLDMSQVELLENIAAENEALMRDYAEPAQMQGFVTDEAINKAASQLPDGLPVDQAEGTRRLSSQEMADVAKKEMMALRQDLEARGLRPGTQRFERALAKTWTNKPIPGAEPGSTEFRKLQEQGQVELTLPGVIRSAVERVEELPEEEVLQSKFLRSVPNVGPGAEVTSTAAGTAIRGAAPVYETVEPQERTRQIFGTPDVLVKGAPDETMPDYPASYSAMHQILAKTELPERIDSYAEKRLKGGSAGIGVYGPGLGYLPGAMSKSTGEYSKAAVRKPSYVPKWLQQKENPTGFGAMTSAQILAGAQKAPEGRVRNAFEAELARRNRAKESLAASEMLRRGRIEGLI